MIEPGKMSIRSLDNLNHCNWFFGHAWNFQKADHTQNKSAQPVDKLLGTLVMDTNITINIKINMNTNSRYRYRYKYKY